jgi:hypothetical protein
MSRKSIAYSFAAVLALTCVAWLSYAPPPSIRFIEFRTRPYGRVAVFHIVNESRAPFHFYGTGPTYPFYARRVQTSDGWRASNIGWCGTGAGLHPVPPHSSTEIEGRAPDDAPSTPFAVGIYFERWTPQQRSSQPRKFFLEAIYDARFRLYRNWLHREPPDPEPTWSAVAQTK